MPIRLIKIGYFCPAGSDSPQPCPPGTYSSTGLQSISQCLPCPDGYYCSDSGKTIVTGQCDAGFYCAKAVGAVIGFIIPNPPDRVCPAGTF